MKAKRTKAVYVVFLHGAPWGVFSSDKKAKRALRLWPTVETPVTYTMAVNYRISHIAKVLGNVRLDMEHS